MVRQSERVQVDVIELHTIKMVGASLPIPQGAIGIVARRDYIILKQYSVVHFESVSRGLSIFVNSEKRIPILSENHNKEKTYRCFGRE
jgi:hypothetical protein